MNTPQFLDLVWCRFPTREHPGRPGPKERPVLILGLSQDGSLVAAAYGTSQAHQQIRAWEILVPTGRNILTIFDLTRIAKLPHTPEYFPGRPRLGRLPENLLGELKKAVASAQQQR